ncbi:MAG: metallophosphoesterase [Cellulosilyticaceae bacterium]
MKILVVSDTHRYLSNLSYILTCVIPAGVRHVIHCGDHITDAKKIEEAFPELKVFAVPGNCDLASLTESKDQIIDIGGVRIYFAHGDRHHVKHDYSELLIDAKAHGAQIAICGHSHVAHLEKKDSIILLNPGSISEPRDSIYPSYAVIEIDHKAVKDIAIMQVVEKNRIVRNEYFQGIN